MTKFKNLNIAVIALVLAVASNAVIAEESETVEIIKIENADARASVEWVDPKKFTDIRSVNMSKAKYQNYVIKELTSHIEELANKLPEGQTLQVKITNLDLAGRVEPGRFAGVTRSIDDVRVVRHVDIPRIAFSYEVTDSQGAVVRSEEVKLKDMGFLSSMAKLKRQSPFSYEKRMLTRWFNKTLNV